MELTIRNITKDYGNKRAVDHVSMKISSGVWGLLGANGAGKTTLMRMIAGILKPTDGEVCYNNVNIINLGEAYRGRFSYLPQTFGFYPEFNVQDYLEYIACLKGLNRHETKGKIEQFLDIMGLRDVRKKKIKKLSGGMQRRVGIAQALLNDPEILVLDEPTSGLDPGERVYFRNILSEFSKERIVMISTHIVSDVEYIAAQNAIMKDGRIIAMGKTDDLVTQIQGKVFEGVVSSGMYEGFEQTVCVVNMKNIDQERVAVRYVADVPMTQNSKSVNPRLEDLYLWIFRDTTEGRGGLS
ncbi:ABC transporter ATP-binding protein [Acetobacterium carbinolicum]|uniref:ABC transporter ATP-binding protein n=1 Tax=Acetobacterium carbinolicum TaxID=52690 RepID=UPI0039BF4B45